jgi:hypothetical protein
MQPVIMMRFRPMRSDSAPNTTNSGMASTRAMATMTLARSVSIDRTFWR